MEVCINFYVQDSSQNIKAACRDLLLLFFLIRVFYLFIFHLEVFNFWI